MGLLCAPTSKTTHNYLNNDVVVYGNVVRTETNNNSTTIFVNDSFDMGTDIFVIKNVQKYICTMQIYMVGSNAMEQGGEQCQVTINEQTNIYTLSALNYYDQETNGFPWYACVGIVNASDTQGNYYVSLTGVDGYDLKTDIAFSITITDKPVMPTKTYEDGYTDGYADGEEIGYTDGYSIGFSDGSKGGSSLLVKPFDLIKQSFTAINTIMNKQIFPGITIWTIVCVPLIFSLLFLILKVIRG